MVNLGTSTSNTIFAAMDEGEQKYVNKAIWTNRVLFAFIGGLLTFLTYWLYSRKKHKNGGSF
jgi:hypothetical protein